MKVSLSSVSGAGQIALALWVVTALVAGWFFVFGQTSGESVDHRAVIDLQPAERELVLREMRGLLSATQGVIDGISRNDMHLVVQSAQSAGMAAAADVNPALMAKLPLSFKTLGMRVHRDMDDIALAAASGETQSQLLARVSVTLSSCVACHASWQLGTPAPQSAMK